jgi:hypothetical protein
MKILAVLFLAAAVVTCGGTDPRSTDRHVDGGVDEPDAGDGPASPTATLVLGGASHDGTGFLPFEGNQALIPGMQGGFHIWLKFRVFGLSPQSVKVTRTVRRVSDGHLILDAGSYVDVGLASAEGYWELPQALPSFMCPSPVGVNLDGARVHFVVTLRDDRDRLLAQADADVTAVCPDDDQAEFCRRICTG